jgi:Lipopolysaccharide kinase (Kdo/WaaP) family
MEAASDRRRVEAGPIRGAVVEGESPERWIDVVERLERGDAPELKQVRHNGACAVFRFDPSDGLPVYIKRHGEHRLQGELQETRFTTPPAERCWASADLLQRCGVGTPRVRAALQVVEGAYLRADYLFVDAITEGPPLSDVLSAGVVPASERAAVLGAVGKLVAHLHVRGIFHGDLKPAHVFRLPDERLSLIDLEYLTIVDPRHPRRYEVARWGDLTTLLHEFQPLTTAGERRMVGEVYKQASGLSASAPLTMQYHWVRSNGSHGKRRRTSTAGRGAPRLAGRGRR